MGVILEDLVQEDRRLRCNWWNWRPTVALIETLRLLDDERLDLMTCNIGVEVEAHEAHAIAEFIERDVLPKLEPDARVRLDGTATSEPDDGIFYSDPDEVWKNYGASREWLRTFATFCRECTGFSVW